MKVKRMIEILSQCPLDNEIYMNSDRSIEIGPFIPINCKNFRLNPNFNKEIELEDIDYEKEYELRDLRFKIKNIDSVIETLKEFRNDKPTLSIQRLIRILTERSIKYADDEKRLNPVD